MHLFFEHLSKNYGLLQNKCGPFSDHIFNQLVLVYFVSLLYKVHVCYILCQLYELEVSLYGIFQPFQLEQLVFIQAMQHVFSL